MKIAYLINHNISNDDGVTKKILGQITEWTRQGHTVEVFCNTPKLGDSILPAKQYLFSSYLKARLIINTELIEDIEQFKPSIIYFRYDTWSKTLSILMKKYKVITEMNTNDLGEYYLLMKKDKTLKSLLRYLSYYFLRSRVLSNVSGIIAVTKEIITLDSVKKFKKPSTYVPNGINLEKFDTLKQKSPDRISLFFIGTPNQPWHGIDIIEILAKKLPEFNFHVVGIDGKSKANIQYHGYLSKEKYTKILQKCHICIGTLALFRNNMTEACPLKVREYLAYGFPTIVGYDDTVFLNEKTPSWFKKINPTHINVDKIREFIVNNKDVTLSHDDVNKYISHTVTEQKRLHFMTEVYNHV